MQWQYGLERVYRFLKEKKQADLQTYLIVEVPGKKEDDELELEFRSVCNGDNYFVEKLPLNLTGFAGVFVSHQL